MKPLALAGIFVCGIFLGAAIAPAKVVTKTIEVPGPERIVNTPPDTAAIASLEGKLKACEEKSAARLDGWRKAQARYEYYELYWQPKSYGGQKNDAAPPPVTRAASVNNIGQGRPLARLFRGRTR